MAKEMWIIITNRGYGPTYSISFRTKLAEQAIDKLIMSELVLPAPDLKINIDECTDDQKVIVQNISEFSTEDLWSLYHQIQKILGV